MYTGWIRNQRLCYSGAVLRRMLSICICRDNADRVILTLQQKGESRFERGALSSIHLMLKDGAVRPSAQLVEYTAIGVARTVIHHDYSLEPTRNKFIYISDEALLRLK